MNPIAQNLKEVRAAIAAAAQRSGRDPGAVRLVAVSKTVDLERIRAAIDAGQDLFGENYLQEARDKIAVLGRQVSWHLVGSLQSNKAREAVALFDLIHAVDRLKLARALDAAAARLGKVQDVLIQVNQAGEATKSGVDAGGGPGAAPGGRPAAAPAGFGPDDHAAVVSRPGGGAPLLPGLAGTARPPAGAHRSAPDGALHGHVRRFRGGGGGRRHPGAGGHRHLREPRVDILFSEHKGQGLATPSA